MKVTLGLNETLSGIDATISATDRETFFRDAIQAALSFAYGGVPPLGDSEGQFVPIQAVGNDDRSIVGELVKECLDAVQNAHGTLHAPRWLAFDVGRVTANLPLTKPAVHAREGKLSRADSEFGPGHFSAQLQFETATGNH
ncbi:MAG: hypothetical protein ABIT01_06520 [Thermoanaerobaculia bacterium]